MPDIVAISAMVFVLIASDSEPGVAILPAILYLIGISSFSEIPLQYAGAGFVAVFLGSQVRKFIKITRV